MKSNFGRVISFVLAVVVIASLFAGCGDYGELAKNPKRFIEVSKTSVDDNAYIILVDTETRVMYLEIVRMNRLGLTAMLNPDGTPMLYDGEL